MLHVDGRLRGANKRRKAKNNAKVKLRRAQFQTGTLGIEKQSESLTGKTFHSEPVVMLKITTILVLSALASPVQAEDCPEFYRFVDFGRADGDGVLRRGGPTFRGFVTEGVSILKQDETVCLNAGETSTDGRKLSIPIVAQINVDPDLAGLNLLMFAIRSVEDASVTATDNASAHRENLAQADTITTKGDSYLCASGQSPKDLSCQVISPYKDNTDLVVYCDGQSCTMPVMAYGTRLGVSASWTRTVTAPDATANEIIRIVQSLHDFFKLHF
jgi:hypothetical protein